MKCRLCLLTSAAAGTPAIFIISLCPPKYEDVSNLKMEITQNQENLLTRTKTLTIHKTKTD